MEKVRLAGAAAASRFLRRLFSEFQRDHCLIRAASLAFASLLALVPLSALLFSLFSALGSFSEVLDNLQSFLLTQLVPTSQEVIMDYVQRFVENTRALGVAGLLFFLLTSVFLLNTIQSSFNAVWGSRSRKNSLLRLATYASILIVGSFLFSIGLNLTGMLGSLLRRSAVEGVGRTLSVLTGVLPSLFIFLALLLSILLIPSGRVRVLSSLIGAAVGAVLWEAARRIFSFWVTYVIRLSIVYGSLAAIPIVLIWLYVAWVIVLLSLETAFIHQHRRLGWLGKGLEQVSPAERFLFGLEIYFQVVGRFYRGEPPPTSVQLARRFAAPLSDIAYFTDLFHQHGLLLFAGQDGDLLIPARSLDKIALKELFQCLYGNPKQAAWQSEEALELFESVTGAALRSLHGRSVLEFLKSSLEPPSTRPTRRRGAESAGVAAAAAPPAGRAARSGRARLASLLDWSPFAFLRKAGRGRGG